VGIIFVVLYASGLCTTVNKNTGQIQDRCLEYRWRRIQAFFNPHDESLSETYQPKQAKIGLGTGGWFGVGLGQSRQKYSYLPESFTDSIFAIIGEELGFVGSFGIILLFFLFYVSGLSIIKNAPDVFGSFLALGLIS
jgi:cell division protein FtsW